MIFQKLRTWFFKATAARLLVLGFAAVIVAGALLLWLPIAHNPGKELSFLEALFESTSAVCVTGLTVVSPGDTFNLFGRIVLGILIQIGGMGVVLMGITLIMITGGRVGFKTRYLFIQAQNLSGGYKGLMRVAKLIIRITFLIEAGGALLLWLLLMKYYDPLRAFGHACFLSVSAFNNAGFDVFHGGASLIPYGDNFLFCTVITWLVIIGGFGFLSMIDLFRCRFHWRKLCLTTKIALFMTAVLLLGGMLLLKWTTGMTWLEAWTQSVIARTAGFATYPMSLFSQGALLIFIVLMFIGASPNSTGGGIKTTTAFVLVLKAFSSSAGHDEDSAFDRKVTDLDISKASTVLFFGLTVVLVSTILVCMAEPGCTLGEVLVEVTSAFATVGSSVGITSSLGNFSRWIIILDMFIGRLGTITIANLLVTRKEKLAHFTEENVLIG